MDSDDEDELIPLAPVLGTIVPKKQWHKRWTTHAIVVIQCSFLYIYINLCLGLVPVPNLYHNIWSCTNLGFGTTKTGYEHNLVHPYLWFVIWVFQFVISLRSQYLNHSHFTEKKSITTNIVEYSLPLKKSNRNSCFGMNIRG